MLVVPVDVGVFIITRRHDQNVRPVHGTANLWESADVEELLGKFGAVFRPVDDFIFECEDGVSHTVDDPEHSVGGGASCISKEVIKTVRSDEVKKDLDLLPRRERTISLCRVLQKRAELFFEVVDNLEWYPVLLLPRHFVDCIAKSQLFELKKNVFILRLQILFIYIFTNTFHLHI